jgi:pimeloyl-ACP methyl ester carboxylesterase
LLGPFRAELAGRLCLVEVSYPRQVDWTLPDYVGALTEALARKGITRGWVLGESFSSQVAWELLTQCNDNIPASKPHFRPDALVLAGGFVRYPWAWAVRLARAASAAVPLPLLKPLCQFYGWLAGRRYQNCSGGVREQLQEFVHRRTIESDRQAITARYRLILDNDFRATAQRVRMPVFHLSGVWDPIVPWWLVRPWLRRHCPAFRGSRLVLNAGHNVLLSAPRKSVEQILDWMGQV